jgi:hypothetical protein
MFLLAISAVLLALFAQVLVRVIYEPSGGFGKEYSINKVPEAALGDMKNDGLVAIVTGSTSGMRIIF